MSSRSLGALVLASLLLVSPRARAQESAADELDAADRAIDEADFATAVLALDRASATAMDHDALLRWLELHALLSFADGRLGALEDALHGYASVAPGVPAPASFPRPLRDRLAELHAQDTHLSVRAEPVIEIEGDHRVLSLPTSVLDDPGHVVRRIEARVRVGDDEPTPLAPGERIVVRGDVHEPVDVSWVLTVIGPGGAIVTTTDEVLETLAGVPRRNDDVVIGAIVGGAIAAAALAAVLAWGATDDWWQGSVTHVHAALVTF